MDGDRAWTTQKLHPKQETTKLTCLFAGSRNEETRALQEEAAQEVSGLFGWGPPLLSTEHQPGRGSNSQILRSHLGWR